MHAAAQSCRMRIALVSSSLQAGGAERALSTLANYWAAIGHDVTIVTLDAVGNDFYRLDTGIRRIALDLLGPSTNLRARISSNRIRVARLRSTLIQMRPAAVVSFVDQMNIMTLVATTGLGIPVVVSERTDPRFHEIGRPWRLLRAMLYPRARAVVVQTLAVYDWASRRVPHTRISVIPNAVQVSSVQRIHTLTAASGKGGTVLAVGRLTSSKGFNLLLAAFADCCAHESGWTLTILGEGPEFASLRELARQLRIAERVIMPGVVKDVASRYQNADIFVMSSQYEGFPNVLLEAMSHGCAVVSFDCPSGPAEIISDGLDGILVPVGDTAKLAQAMMRLMRSQALRHSLGQRAAANMRRYAPGTVMPMWDKLLASILP